MQNGVTFSGGMNPEAPFEIKVRYIFTYDRGKCKTVFEVKRFLPQTRFRTFHETLLKHSSATPFLVKKVEFSLKT